MVFSSWQPSLSFHRILVLRVKTVPHQWRQVSTTSAINRGLRGTKDDAYSTRGGRGSGPPRRDGFAGSSGRSRPQGFMRSDGPRRNRDDDASDGSTRTSRKPKDDSQAYSPRGRGDDFSTQGRSMRTRGNSGFRGQPGFAIHPPQEDIEQNDTARQDRRRPLGFEPQSRSDGARDGAFSGGRDRVGGRPQRDFSAGRQEFKGRRERDSDEGRRSFAGRRDGDLGGRQNSSFDGNPRVYGGDRNRESYQGQRDPATSRTRNSERPRRNEMGSEARFERTEDSASAVESKEDGDGARTGLLRDVKTACRLIKSIQKSEASGEDTSELVNMTMASLRSVNRYLTSGKFQDEPSEAIASLFEKKAAQGTFIDIADAASANASVLFQRGDGKIELAAKRQDSVMPSLRALSKSETSTRYREASSASARNDFDRGSVRGRDSRTARSSEPREEEDDGIPISVPYTTAASEFLYGSNVVLAALKAQRRKLYHLYVHPKIFERETSGRSGNSRYAKPAHEFVALAKSANVPFRNEFKTYLLDKMSDGRPHNGIILEASKLPAPPILSVGKPDARKSVIPLFLGSQSAEEAAVNGGQDTISLATNTWRHPLIIMLDGILDEGNVGNIMRTCHFYGADAVAVATNTCAPLASAVLAKASSGACEAVHILSLPQPSNFVHDSAKAGWKIYAAVAPESGKPSRDAKPQLTTAEIAAASPLADHPCILMLGAEGEGLRENLKNRADAFVSIERGPSNAPDVGVDSMNVGVAAGVLMEAFLRKPAGAPEKRDTTSELGF